MTTTETAMLRRSWIDVLAVLLVIGFIAMAFFTPAERTQGDVARLFYLHVPGILMAYAAFGVALVGSVAYLATRKLRWACTLSHWPVLRFCPNIIPR